MTNEIFGSNDWGQTDGTNGGDTVHLGEQGGVARGHNGDDIVNGSDKRDRLHGDNGDDSLDGGNGRDFLWGGSGDDTLTGGHNIDTFVYSSHDTGNDTITDFVTQTDKGESLWQDVLALKDLTSIDQLSFAQEGDNLIISIEDRGTITLENVTLEQLRFGQMLEGAEMYCYTASNAPHSNILLNIEVPDNWQPTLSGTSSQNTEETEEESTETETNNESSETASTATANTNTTSSTTNHNSNMQTMGDATDETLNGTTSRDYLNGGDGNDDIKGGDGHDYLHGGMGYDKIDGGNGSDLIIGGMNAGEEGKADILTGGAGRDVFHFNAFCSSGTTEIPDFNPEEDILTLDNVDFDTLTLTQNSTGTLITMMDETGMYQSSIQITGMAMDGLNTGSYSSLSTVTQAARGESSGLGRSSFSRLQRDNEEVDLSHNILIKNKPENWEPTKIVQFKSPEAANEQEAEIYSESLYMPAEDVLYLDAVYAEYEALEII